MEVAARAWHRQVRGVVGIAMLVGMAACGGGGDDGASSPGNVTRPTAGVTGNYAQRCVAPRPTDARGSLSDELRWVQAWNNETYLWYREVVDRGPAAFSDPVSYFDTLRTTAVTASGRDKDNYHFTYDTPTWVALSQRGESFGYGFEVSLLSDRPPRRAVVAYTNPGTAAAAAGIARGAQILAVDGADLVNGSTQADVDTLNAGLFPRSAGSHTLRILDLNAVTPRNVTLTAATQTIVPVPHVRTLPAPYQSVGYLLFNDHIATSEAQLVSAINQLRTAAVTDLVLDVRYNGGGYLDIASELAYMIAGPARTQGKAFEVLQFNDKNPFQLTLAQRTTPFHAQSQGFSVSTGQALPTLNLRRVFVLAGPDTCSASESVVNGLRGAGVEVVLVGEPTCGKPYGFYPTDNCNVTYFTIQFQGVNHLGFGDYADGLAPTCRVSDDFAHALGDPAEARLSVALGYRNTGSCTPVSTGAQALRAGVAEASGRLVRSPLRESGYYRKR